VYLLLLTRRGNDTDFAIFLACRAILIPIQATVWNDDVCGADVEDSPSNLDTEWRSGGLTRCPVIDSIKYRMNLE